MKNLFNFLSILCIAVTTLACGKEPQSGAAEDFNISGIVIPKSLSVRVGDEVQFKVIGSKGPKTGDQARLSPDTEGSPFDIALESCKTDSFVLTIPEGFTTGTYTMYIVRGGVAKTVGRLTASVLSSLDVTPDPDATVYGVVECSGKGIPDVVVSDGINTVQTDEDGIYQLQSEKKNGYVFISIPSGYEVLSSGVLPQFHCYLKEPAATPERADFSLVESADQTSHTMLVFGDIHLADRTGDKTQFADFVTDINAFTSSAAGRKIYGLTLGDMSWEAYWLSNSFDLSAYLAQANRIDNLQIFHTIGNHDHEMEAAGDFNTVIKYKKIIAPTYYSFNIGKVHYVVLDDIECTNTGAGDPDSRHYTDKIVSEQLDWLEKDLSYIAKTTPVVIAMHAPLYTDRGTNSLNNAATLKSILGGYDNVQIYTGHTHKVYNVDKTGSDHIFEHNAGAVCATWWWSGYETPGIHIGTDGAPGGYSIVNVDGTDFKWKFKATGKPAGHQFRTYDRNCISITADKYVPFGTAADKYEFNAYASEWSGTSTADEVYINVWNYDTSWKVEVSENGSALDVEKVEMRDPLHLIAYSAKRLNKGSACSFPTSVTRHFFKTTASSPSSTLEIKVTDRFGNIYTETMKRPKEFTEDNYRK